MSQEHDTEDKCKWSLNTRGGSQPHWQQDTCKWKTTVKYSFPSSRLAENQKFTTILCWWDCGDRHPYTWLVRMQNHATTSWEEPGNSYQNCRNIHPFTQQSCFWESTQHTWHMHKVIYYSSVTAKDWKQPKYSLMGGYLNKLWCNIQQNTMQQSKKNWRSSLNANMEKVPGCFLKWEANK